MVMLERTPAPWAGPDDIETLGSFLKCLRGSLDLSKIAKRINYAVSLSGIRNIEDGLTRRPRDTTLRLLAQAYATDPAEQARIYRHMLRLAGYDLLEMAGDVVPPPQNPAEERVIERYRALDAEARAAFDRMLEVLLGRQSQGQAPPGA